MSLVDGCLMVSVLVVVAIVAKMLRAIRLLDGRVSVLQEQLEHSRTTTVPTIRKPAPKLSGGRTPVEGVPITTPTIRRTPSPEDAARDPQLPSEAATHTIEQAEADAIWAQLEAEQERLRKAMGRDFQARARQRSASEIRGRPVARTLSAQELARKLERR